MRKRTILFRLFMILFALAIPEIGARIYLGVILQKTTQQKFRFNSYRVFEQMPNFREGDGTRDWIVINRNGFRRNQPVHEEKPAGTFRVFLLGGSAAHGVSSAPPYPIVHVYNNQTIDAYLESQLEAEFPDTHIEIINAAVTAYQVFQHTAYLLSELLDYEPDLVIFFDGANDHYYNNPEFNYYTDYIYQFWKSRLQNPSLGGLFDYFASYMANYSALFRGYLAWQLPRDGAKNSRIMDPGQAYGSPEELLDQHRNAAEKQFLRSIHTNLDILDRHGIDAILSLQPMLVLRQAELLSESELAFLHEDERVQILYPVVRQELSLLAKEHGVAFLDLNPVFNQAAHGKQQLFIDYVHLNARGGRVAADALLPLVRDKIRAYLGQEPVHQPSEQDLLSTSKASDPTGVEVHMK